MTNWPEQSIGGTLAAGILLILCLLSACRRQEIRSDQDIRVVCLAPNLTEIVCAVDAEDLLVGRTSACKYPPASLEDIPIVGGFGTPSLEMLVALKPTVILEVDLEDKALGRKIDQLGLNRQRIPCHRLQDIPLAIRQIGKIVQREAKASKLADAMQKRLAELHATAPKTNLPSVYIEVWSDPFITAGKNSFVADVVRLAGGRNIGDVVENKNYYAVSSEWVVSRNPDIIISLAGSMGPSQEQTIPKRAGWGTIKAVQSSRVYQSTNAAILTSPCPRILDAIEEIRTYLAPDGNEPKERKEP